MYKQIETGKDAFNHPIYSEEPVSVDNVLVSPEGGSEVVDQTNLYGKKAVYKLAIPKDDENDWEDQVVEFFGQRWRTFGYSVIGPEHLIPLDWNRIAKVERYG